MMLNFIGDIPGGLGNGDRGMDLKEHTPNERAGSMGGDSKIKCAKIEELLLLLLLLLNKRNWDNGASIGNIKKDEKERKKIKETTARLIECKTRKNETLGSMR